jgi:hypothetical protein
MHLDRLIGLYEWLRFNFPTALRAFISSRDKSTTTLRSMRSLLSQEQIKKKGLLGPSTKQAQHQTQKTSAAPQDE